MRDNLVSAYALIQEHAADLQVTLRLTGSIAVQIRCPRYAPLVGPERAFTDLDLVARKRDATAIRTMLERMGYAERREIYLASEGGRAIYDHPQTRVHLDIFFDKLEFCHVIDVRHRIDLDNITLPLAELLMGKLQIVEINEKDLRDASILLLEHPLGDTDEGMINSLEISRLCAEEWGLWRTASGNLDKVSHYARSANMLTVEGYDHLTRQITALRDAIDAHPKPFSWRMRARVGERMKWYRDVEEVEE